MGVAYRLDEKLGLTLTVFDGIVTADEWKSTVLRIFSDPAWPPGRFNLTDLRTAKLSSLTAEDRAEIIELNGSKATHLDGMKSAAIGGRNFAVADTFEREDESSGMRLIVFNDLPPACAWLGVDAAAIAPMIEQLRQDMRESTAGAAQA